MYFLTFIFESPLSDQLQQGFVSFKSFKFWNFDSFRLIGFNISIKLFAVVKW